MIHKYYHKAKPVSGIVGLLKFARVEGICNTVVPAGSDVMSYASSIDHGCNWYYETHETTNNQYSS